MQVSNSVSSRGVGAQLGLCAAAVAGTAAVASSAQAALVTTFQNNSIVVPATSFGIYINLETGGTGLTSAATPGWDFNPYQTSSGLGFYWSGSPLVGGLRAGGVTATSTGTTYVDLAPNTVVGPASFYTSAIQGTSAAFRTTGTHTLGFRFVNGTGTAFDYGYLSITTTTGTAATSGFPATVNGWVFDDSGASVTTPNTPEPASIGLIALAAGAMGVRGWRRKSVA